MAGNINELAPSILSKKMTRREAFRIAEAAIFTGTAATTTGAIDLVWNSPSSKNQPEAAAQKYTGPDRISPIQPGYEPVTVWERKNFDVKLIIGGLLTVAFSRTVQYLDQLTRLNDLEASKK